MLKYPVALFFSTVHTTSSNSRWSRPGIKLNGLGDVAVFFLDRPIVGSDVHRVLTLFYIGLLELQAHGRDRLRLGAFEQCEFVVVAVALVFQNFQVALGMSDQSALHPQIANRALQLGLRRLKIGSG